MNKFLSVSLLLITFLIGFGTGFAASPEYADQMKNKQEGMPSLGQADKFVDKRYITGMISHHLKAIDMAKQALENSHRTEVRELAEKIIAVDEASIKELESWKAAWYGDNRPVTTVAPINLGTNDGNFDLRFINALIAHHEEAIVVATEIQHKSSRNEILTLASTVQSGLSEGVINLKNWRRKWYAL